MALLARLLRELERDPVKGWCGAGCLSLVRREPTWPFAVGSCLLVTGMERPGIRERVASFSSLLVIFLAVCDFATAVFDSMSFSGTGTMGGDGWRIIEVLCEALLSPTKDWLSSNPSSRSLSASGRLNAVVRDGSSGAVVSVMLPQRTIRLG